MPVRRGLRRRPLAAYVAIAYGFSWGIWIPSQLLFPPTFRPARPGVTQLLAMVGTFGPAVAAVVVARGTGTWPELKARLLRWRVPLRWYAVAVGLPALVGAVGYGVYRLLGGVPFDAARSIPPELLAIVFVVTLVAGGGNEEPGWRGFALPRLQAEYGPLGGSLVLAVLWAGWHLPAFLDPASSQAGVPPIAWTVAVVALTAILTWLFNVAGESVPVAVLFHTAFNVALVWVVSGLPPGQLGTYYWSGVAIVVVVALVAALVTRGALGVSQSSDA